MSELCDCLCVGVYVCDVSELCIWVYIYVNFSELCVNVSNVNLYVGMCVNE